MADRESYMSAVIIEHVNVADLPETWRAKLSAPQTARVTVRIETEETAANPDTTGFVTNDPAFGIWRDHEDLTDVAAYLRRLR
jgi:diaminopimelate decarboxylase